MHTKQFFLILAVFGFILSSFDGQEAEKKATINGTITQGDIALPRANVELLQGDVEKPAESTVTGPDGSYSFSSVPLGKWKLKVVPEGGSPRYFQVNVNSPSVTVSPLSTTPDVSPSATERWTVYGFEDSPGKWSQKYFVIDGGEDREPREGDVVVATGDIFARKDYMQFNVSLNSWNEWPEAVGVIKKGQKLTIKHLAYPKNPADTSPSKFIFISF